MTLSLVAAAVSAFALTAPGEIRVGEQVSGTLRTTDDALPDHGASQRFRLVGDVSGPITIRLDSFDFDAFLRIEDAAAAPLAEADAGGIETNARVVLPLESARGTIVAVVASAHPDRSGEFLLAVDSGEPAPQGGGARLDAASAFRDTAATRAIARGDLGVAASHRHEQGQRLRERSHNAGAESAFESALGLAREAGDRSLEARALGGIGACLRELSNSEGARACHLLRLRLARRAGDRAETAAAIGGLGVLRYHEGEYELAGALHRRHLEIARALGDRHSEMNASANLAAVAAGQGDNERASELYTRAFEIARDVGATAREASYLGNLGVIHERLGDVATARDHYQRQLELARSSGDPSIEVNALGHLGSVASSIGDYETAQRSFDQELARAREIADRTGELDALESLGVLATALGDYDEALKRHEEARSISRETGNRVSEVIAIRHLGVVHNERGEFDLARQCFVETLEAARTFGDRLGEAQTLTNLGGTWMALGEIAEARRCFESSLDLARQMHSRFGELANVHGLTQVWLAAGDYATALRFGQQAVDLSITLGDPQGEARARVAFGLVQREVGAYAAARVHFERALEIAQTFGLRNDEAHALGNVGLVCVDENRLDEGLSFLERQLHLARELGERALEAIALGNIGTVREQKNEFDAARDCYEKELEIARDLGDRLEEARVQLNLGVLYDRLSKWDLARARSREAVALYEELGDDESSLYAWTTLLEVAIDTDDVSAALEAWVRARGFLERPAVRALASNDAAGLRSRSANLSEIFQDLVRLRLKVSGADARRFAEAVGEGFREAGRFKGRALLEGIAEGKVGGRTPAILEQHRVIRETEARRRALRDRIGAAIQDKRPSEEVNALRNEDHALASLHDELFAGLRKISPREADLERPIGVSPEEARRTIVSADTALLEYVEGRTQLCAYVLTRSDLRYVDLGLRDEIDEMTRALLLDVSDPNRLGTPESIAVRGRALFDRLLAPALAVAGDGIKALVIVPSTSLAVLPFEALVAGTTGDAPPKSFAELVFAIDRFTMSYAPSTPVLAEIAALPARVGEDRALVLADPLYPSEAAPAGGTAPIAAATRGAPVALADWSRLIKTRDEAFAVSRLRLGGSETQSRKALEHLGTARSLATTIGKTDLCLGAEARAERLAGDLRRYAVIHLACHAYVDVEDPRRTALVLSGSNEDVYVTLDQIVQSALDADEVVLSACETARGRVLAGEGLQSLARTFLLAGSRSVVASLWNVSDVAGAETMQAYYEGRRDGLAAGEALRRAKRSLRGSTAIRTLSRGVGGVTANATPSNVELAHPFFWAPFIHVGLPRR